MSRNQTVTILLCQQHARPSVGILPGTGTRANSHEDPETPQGPALSLLPPVPAHGPWAPEHHSCETRVTLPAACRASAQRGQSSPWARDGWQPCTPERAESAAPLPSPTCSATSPHSGASWAWGDFFFRENGFKCNGCWKRRGGAGQREEGREPKGESTGLVGPFRLEAPAKCWGDRGVCPPKPCQ